MALSTDAASRSRAWISTVRGITALVAGTALVGTVSAVPANAVSAARPPTTLPAVSSDGLRHACLRSHSPHRLASCGALVFSNAATATPSGGLTPSDFASAYQLPSGTSAGRGQRIYVVDAYDDTTAESDLAAYRSYFNLPACTTANGCFQKVNQNMQPSPLPAPASPGGWDVEAALDLEMVSAACPNCGITLVEANSATNDLDTAVGNAVAAGAKFLSLSWGAQQDYDDAAYDNHPGVAYFAASGDNGWAGYSSSPASHPNVIAVGGTTLTRDGSARGWSESAWSNTGSACSTMFSTTSFQRSAISGSGCTMRASVDVSAHAAGAAVYAQGGWLDVGGTSEATPLVAGIAALDGAPPATVAPYSQMIYANSSLFNDVTSGNNDINSATPCPVSEHAMCYARAGWDGPTGVGSPDRGSFVSAPAVLDPTSGYAVVGRPSSFTIRTSGYPLPTITASGTLPAGEQFVDNGDGTGTLSGTPTAPGIYQFSVTVSNSLGIVRGDIVQNVQQAPDFTSGASATVQAGKATSFTITTTGTPLPRITSGGTLPPGESLSDQGNGTAILSGMPTTVGTYQFTVSAQNSVGTATQTFVQTVQSAQQAPTFTSEPSAAVTTSTPLSYTVTSTGYPVPTISASSLPSWVTLTDNHDGTALLQGMPPTTGNYTFTLSATNVNGTATQAFTATVQSTLAAPSSAPWTIRQNARYSTQLHETGGTAPFVFRAASFIPPGITLSPNGVLTALVRGFTNAPYTIHLAYLITDADGTTVDGEQIITVNPGPPVWLAQAPLHSGTHGHSYLVAIRLGGGWGADTVTRSAGALPPGLKLTPEPGRQGVYVSGRAGRAGLYHFTLKARDTRGEVVSRTFRLLIH